MRNVTCPTYVMSGVRNVAQYSSAKAGAKVKSLSRFARVRLCVHTGYRPITRSTTSLWDELCLHLYRVRVITAYFQSARDGSIKLNRSYLNDIC